MAADVAPKLRSKTYADQNLPINFIFDRISPPETGFLFTMKHWTLDKQVKRQDEVGRDKFSPLATILVVNLPLHDTDTSVDQLALLSGFGRDLRHEYGISGRESKMALVAFRT